MAELRRLEVSALEDEFGRYGVRLYELARGIDDNPVVSDRPTQSISVEDTFEQDVLLNETEPIIRRLAEKLWSAYRLVGVGLSNFREPEDATTQPDLFPFHD